MLCNRWATDLAKIAVGVQALHRFAQAGRRVIHRNRAAKRLSLINTLVHSIKQGSSEMTSTTAAKDRSVAAELLPVVVFAGCQHT